MKGNRKELLSQSAADLILSITFPKTMRWGDGDLRFRPIHWLLAILGEEVIPFSLAGVESGETYGHRFLSKGYQHWRTRVLRKDTGTLCHCRSRREEKADQEECRKNWPGSTGKVLWDEDLLEEIIYLVEYPTALVVPSRPTTWTCPWNGYNPHEGTQRYSPGRSGGELPCFITVRNGTAENRKLSGKETRRSSGPFVAPSSSMKKTRRYPWPTG